MASVLCVGGPIVAQDVADTGALRGAIEPPFAWNRADRYEPPNFEAFFPDDVEAGKQLDRFLAGQFEVATVEERLALIRRGLRHMSGHRTILLGSVGNQFVWNREQQDPRAIELLYHASASPDGETAYYALYHGPTVVNQRTPNLVRMLMERYHQMHGELQGRIAWGMKTYGDKQQSQKLLLDLLDNHTELEEHTTAAAIDTYRAVFGEDPPGMERFDGIGRWVIGFYRNDVAANHPRAAELLRETLTESLADRQQQLIELVFRADADHEVAVALVQGERWRTEMVERLTADDQGRVVINELLSPQTLHTYRLREFARYLPGGLPEGALPEYTRPPADATYAHRAEEFVAPDYHAFFTDDAAAGQELDRVYAIRATHTLSDRELLDLVRRGLRRSSHSPQAMLGWISGSLGWPRDPLLTEIFYQTLDPRAPLKVRSAGVYFGFPSESDKTANVLQAMYGVYMTPPFDRTTNNNMRSRILWSVRNQEDQKQALASRFAKALADHASLSDQELQAADSAYRELTGNAPPMAAEYAARGLYLVMYADRSWKTIDQARQQMDARLDAAPQLVASTFGEHDDQVVGIALVRGRAGLEWMFQRLQADGELRIFFADLLTREVIEQAEGDILQPLEKYAPPEG